MANSDDEVPPLEDMSELLSHIESIKEEKSQTTKQKTVSNGTDKDKIDARTETKAPPSKTETGQLAKPKDTKQTTFGGMKKGFLFGGSSSKPKQTPNKETSVTLEDKTFIKPKDPSSKDKQYEIPEVQAAMAANQNLLQNSNQWVTEDLLTKMSKNENISKHLTDPRYAQAIAEFQANPQAAIKKYAGNTELETFLKEFCGIMGDHFMKIGDQQPATQAQTPSSGVPTSTNSRGADISVHKPDSREKPSTDDSRVQEIINDPEMRAILMDPQIQQLFASLRTDPHEAQRMMQKKDPELQMKIRKLASAGLLQVQR